MSVIIPRPPPRNTNNLSHLVKTCSKPPLIFLSRAITNGHWLNAEFSQKPRSVSRFSHLESTPRL